MDPIQSVSKAVYKYSPIEIPRVTLTIPSFLLNIPKFFIFVLAFISYFFITSGIMYDLINEPPSVGSVPDPATGKPRPQAVLPYRMNSQYIIEGFAAGFLFSLGAIGILLINKAMDGTRPLKNVYILCGSGAAMVLLAYNLILMFLRIKVPGYMR